MVGSLLEEEYDDTILRAIGMDWELKLKLG